LSLSCTKRKTSIYQEQSLNNHWQFWQKNKPKLKYPATVPGCVHLDLYNNNLIDDPYYSNNEEKIRWIEKENWVYETTFTISDSLLNKDYILLNFKGIDTYADIYLNEVKLLPSKNMFLPVKINAKGILQRQNTLRVEFQSAVMQAEPLYNSHIRLPADNDRNAHATSVYTRKAPYQYGWDWGPRLVGVGLWKDVSLEFWDGLEVINSRIFQKQLTNEAAVVGLDIQVQAQKAGLAQVEVVNGDHKLFSKSIPIKKGETQISESFSIQHHLLWWPNGSGDAHLYHFNLKISLPQQKWKKDFTLGFRTVELQRKKDSIGETFTFLVNGQALYIKGANYIPQDLFPSRVKKEDDRQTLKMVQDAHMNMLRVWGGGIYEQDEFYNMCDEMGILIWQDFMFACSLYPADTAFLSNIKNEATFQIQRLRDHPSLALWCGNNEINELWHNWGYQKAYGYSSQDSTKLWHDYLNIFDTLLPQLVQRYHTQTSYLESSPVFGWGHQESMKSGDSHYWGIWWGKQPFETYQQKIPRFSSEFGFQSLPHLNTILSFTDSSQLDLFSVDMKAHQKSSIGNQTIMDYLPKYFPNPKNFDELIYVSQLLQAYGMDMAFRAQKLAKPRCMGTLYWQLDDCWPGLSWSSIDYYHQKKATQYVARQDFSNFLIQSEVANDVLTVTLSSDSLKTIQADVEILLVSFSGDTLKKITQAVELKATKVQQIKLTNIHKRLFHPGETFIYSKLTSQDKLLAEHYDFFGKPKDLQLPKSQIHINQIADNQFIITSNPAVFNYAVYLSCQAFGNFEPNFFHLAAGDSILVHFQPMIKGTYLSAKDIKALSLNNVE